MTDQRILNLLCTSVWVMDAMFLTVPFGLQDAAFIIGGSTGVGLAMTLEYADWREWGSEQRRINIKIYLFSIGIYLLLFAFVSSLPE